MLILTVATVSAALTAGFVLSLTLWGRWSQGREIASVQRMTKNGAFLLFSQFAIKGLDFLFALVMLRVLEPEGYGQYGVAVLYWLYLKTLTDFGLGMLATQRIAANPDRAGKLLGCTTLLRLALLGAFAPVLALYIGVTFVVGRIDGITASAVMILALSIIPTTYTDAATSVFNGRERFEVPAAVAMLGSVLGLVLRLGVLFAGWGPVGLASVALAANFVTLLVVAGCVRALGVRAMWSLSRPEAGGLLRAGWPLLVNGLLASLFFRVDTFILQPLKGEYAVGLYNVSYQLINTLLVVSSTLTLVLFPQLTRQASEDRAALARTHALAVRVLLLIGLPAATATALLAPEIVGIIAGADYLPGAADALRITIWLVPLSFVNGVTQYVLIALGLQARMTWAFLATVAFNVGVNLLVIPAFSYRGAAAVSVLSELVLLVPFAVWVRGSLGTFPLVRLAWRPAVASVALALVMWTVGWRLGAGSWAGAAAGTVTYIVALLALREIVELKIMVNKVGVWDRRV